MRPAPALLAAAALAGCGGRNLPGDVTWESEHFAYKTRTGEQVACADVLPALEEHFQSMQRALGFDWPQGAKVTYYKFEDVLDYQANNECGSAGSACAPGTTVQTSEAFNPHELVHAYLRHTGYPPALLLEGAAVALSCASWRRPQPTVSWREAFGLSTSGPRATDVYNAGGWLAGYLLATRGARAFVGLYRDAGAGETADQFAATFARIYGEALDDVWTEMIAAGRPPAFCPWECGRPQAPVDGVTPVATDVTCGIPRTHALTLAQPGELVATLTGVSNFSLGVCGAGSVPPATFYTATTATASTHVDYVLAAGDYFVTGPFGDAALTLSPHPPHTFVTSDCTAAATAPPWLERTDDVAVMVPRGMWKIDLAWTAPTNVLLSPPPAPSTASICPACGATSGTCIVPASAAAPVQGARTLRIGADPIAGGPELIAASLAAR
jgi:hypothetical protein